MFAIAFDLDTRDTERHHPKSVSQAYTDIGTLLKKYDFEWRQGSVYVSDNEDLGILFEAMNALTAMAWFPASVTKGEYRDSGFARMMIKVENVGQINGKGLGCFHA